MTNPVNTRARRVFLKLAASSALLTTLFTLSAGCSQYKTDLESLARRMLDMLNHPAKAAEIGAKIIARTPELQGQSYERIAEDLLALLKIDPGNIQREAIISLETKLKGRVRQDFTDENVIVIEGWMLSRTEAMLCALAARYA